MVLFLKYLFKHKKYRNSSFGFSVVEKKGLFHDPRGVPTTKTQTKMNILSLNTFTLLIKNNPQKKPLDFSRGFWFK